MLKALATIASVLAFLIVVGIAGFFWLRGQGATHQLAKAEAAQGAATVDAGQAHAQADAQRIVVAGEHRETVDIHVHQDNAAAIAAAPGASARLDPALVAAFNNGLHRYEQPADQRDGGGLQMLPNGAPIVQDPDPAGDAPK